MRQSGWGRWMHRKRGQCVHSVFQWKFHFISQYPPMITQTNNECVIGWLLSCSMCTNKIRSNMIFMTLLPDYVMHLSTSHNSTNAFLLAANAKWTPILWIWWKTDVFNRFWTSLHCHKIDEDGNTAQCTFLHFIWCCDDVGDDATKCASLEP